MIVQQRLISNVRAKKLRKRGEHVWWSEKYDSYMWEMKLKELKPAWCDCCLPSNCNRRNKK